MPRSFRFRRRRRFYELLKASASKEPDAMKTFVAAHPEFAAFGEWATKGALDRQLSRKTGTTASTASSSPTLPARIMRCAGRCCRRRKRFPISPEDLAKRGPDVLEQEITERVGQRAAALDVGGDRRQSRRSHRRSDQGLAGRSPHRRGRHAHRAADRSRGATARAATSTSIPTVLPAGMRTSDDPFPAARSAAYAKSYDLRTAEAKDYPRTATEAKP